MDEAKYIIILGALHFIGDFAFQSNWMAMEKGRSWEVLLYHVLTYTAPFALLFLVTERATIAGLVFIAVTHFIEDAAKARYQLIKTIWADQLVHLVVLAIALKWQWM